MTLLIFIADGWGAKFGGINSFNYDLCLAIPEVLDDNYKAVCITKEATHNEITFAKGKGLEIIVTGNIDFDSDTIIIEEINKRYEAFEKWWIGHDIKTGFRAIECAKRTGGKSVIIHHMNYGSYYIHMSGDAEKTEAKQNQQEQLLFEADKVFSVGPKLKKSAEDLIKIKDENSKKTVTELIPGLAAINPIKGQLNKFTAITFGRLSDETNVIKQVKLAVAAFSDIYGKEIESFGNDAEVYAIGLNNDDLKKAQSDLRKFASKFAQRLVSTKGLPYTDDREVLFKHLRTSSVCMMLSLHEGFGLVGFEAIAAGIPLIISKNSGLYEFLDGTVGAVGIGGVYGVDILGSDDENSFNESDLENISRAIKNIKLDYSKCKSRALELREHLLSKEYTWQKTAETFIKSLEDLFGTRQPKIEIGSQPSAMKIEPIKHQASQESEKWFCLEDKHFAYKEGIIRSDLNEELDEKLNMYNVVSVEGIKGIGKEYFVESYFKSKVSESLENNVLIYCLETGETVDDLFLGLESEFKLNEKQHIRRFREFFELLSKKNKTLVINKFHRANKESFGSFIDYAIQYKEKINLIFLSDTSVECSSDPNKIGRVKMRGFNIGELREYIELQKVHIQDSNVEMLLKKTGGNPFAVSIFCYMVGSLEFEVKSLLKGNIVDSSETLKTWIEKIKSLLTQEELILLQLLSLCENPFNRNLANYLITCLNNQRITHNIGTKPIPESAFTGLLKKYLVQKVTKYRWGICDVIAEFFGNSFTNGELKRLGHELLGRYYLKNFMEEKNHQNDETKKLNWLLQSCSQFQSAERFDKSSKIIEDIRKIVKKNGYYEVLTRICENEMKSNKEYDNWLPYNLAHCYLILGRTDMAGRTLKRGIENCDYSIEASKKLSMARLYSEVLNEKGKAGQGLKILRDELKKIDIKKIKPHLIDQIKHTEATLLTEIGEYEECMKICDELMNSVENAYAKPIALTRKAIVYKKQGNPSKSIDLLSEAVDTFKFIKDKRGQSWALLHLGIVLVESNIDANQGYKKIEQAIDIKSKIGESLRDYKEILMELIELALPEKVRIKVMGELQRLNGGLDKVSCT